MSIETTDVRIGNLIYAGDIIVQIGYCSIRSNIAVIPVGMVTQSPIMDCGYFMPIPLTEEWLVNFGYVKQSDGITWQGKYHQIEELTYGLFTDKKNGIVIKYVHQLQNLYYALTQEELTYDSIATFRY